MKSTHPFSQWIYAVALLFVSTCASAQNNYCYSGVLIDSTARAPLEGIGIFHGNDCLGYSDETGYFHICFDSPTDSLWLRSGEKQEHIGLKEVAGEDRPVYTISLESPRSMAEVVVLAFESGKSNAATPGSYGIVSDVTIRATDNTSLQNALNTIPGVIMESRGYGGSHRISIRGSQLRSPFAVRNVKMYLEGIPLTSPDGTAPMELLDPSDLEGIEVIKGPAGSTWGSGNGGVLLMKARRAAPGFTTLQSQFTAGSFGLFRESASAGWSTEKLNVRLSFAGQDNQGYRALEFNRRAQYSAFLHYYASRRLSYFLYSTYYNGSWGLPGSLNAAQVEADPTQAVPYSDINHASLWRERVFNGLSQVWRINNRISNTTSLYFNTTRKENPYGTSASSSGYKVEGAEGWGGRTSFDLEGPSFGNIRSGLHVGGEFQHELFSINEFTLDQGGRGDRKYRYEVGYNTAMAYVSSFVSYNSTATLEAGLSTNKTVHQISGYNGALDQDADTSATWASQLLPRVAFSLKVLPEFYLHASLSSGNSHPTIFEQVDAVTGYLVKNLVPESGFNREIGLKGKEKWSGIDVEICYYSFSLRDAILPYTVVILIDSVETERTSYSNTGNATQKGMEAQVSRSFVFRDHPMIQEARIYGGLSAANYRFGQFLRDGNELGGKRFSGVPLYTVSSGISLALFHLLDIQVMHYWFDRLPLNDENSAWTRSYHLLNIRADIHRVLGHGDGTRPSWEMRIFGGMNNVLGAEYTSFANLNAFGGKYYNPAPPINFYGGLEISLSLPHRKQ